jgi:hypothetical protein
MTELPKGFFTVRRHVTTIEYDSNYFAEKPRAFRIHMLDWTSAKLSNLKNRTVSFENVAPKYNASRGCYTLNFFGRVSKASARNF